jgi:hypothetical protein
MREIDEDSTGDDLSWVVRGIFWKNVRLYGREGRVLASGHDEVLVPLT